MTTNRQQIINTFYDFLNSVIEKFPKRSLGNLGSLRLPEKGVYFFFENGEKRNDKIGDRVVRVGTHAISANSKATLYNRLYNHKGSKDLTGNHRGSVFRKLIGLSIANRDKLNFNYWGDKSKKNDHQVKVSEKQLEIAVSKYLYSMTFTVLEVSGQSSKDNDRALIEDNSIALLSNYSKPAIDKYSNDWLGLYSKDEKVISSGLWNSDGVDRDYLDDQFFKIFENHLRKMSNWQ